MMLYNQDNIIVRESTIEDCEYLKDNLKESDVREIWLSHNHTPEEALKISYEKSVFCATVKNGKPIAMFGVYASNLLGNIANIWMLSTGDLEKIGRRFIRHSRKFIDYMLEYYPLLENYVHTDNKESIAWLNYCGAIIENAEHFGIEQELFHHFYFRR